MRHGGDGATCAVVKRLHWGLWEVVTLRVGEVGRLHGHGGHARSLTVRRLVHVRRLLLLHAATKTGNLLESWWCAWRKVVSFPRGFVDLDLLAAE